MKFIISKDELLYLINTCQSVIPQKPSMPLLANFLIEATRNELIFTATDMRIGIKTSVEAKVIEEGVTTLPAKTFAPLIRELTATHLEISANEQHVTEVLANSSKFKLNGMNPEGYPHLPSLSGAASLLLQQKELKEAFSRTAFAVSKDDKRHELLGLNLTVHNGRVTFIGTDGKKLCRTYLSLPAETEYSGSMIVPLKTVEEMIKNLEEEGEVRLFFMSDKVAFQTANTTITSKLVTGDYPDVNQVIPTAIQSHVTLHREELMTLLRQVALFKDDQSHSVLFTLDQGQLYLTANTVKVGEGDVRMPVDWSGSRFDIALNPTVFLEILRHCKQEVVTLGLIDAYNPSILNDTKEPTPPEPESNPLFLMMPMRLNHQE